MRYLVALLVAIVGLPLAAWWTMSVHEPHCEWQEAFWNGDRPVGEGKVGGLVLGSSRSGTDYRLSVLAERTGYAWQRLARHTLTGSALPPTYSALLAASDAVPGELEVLVVEVSPLLFDQTSCGRAPIPHVAMNPRWFARSSRLGLDERPSAMAMWLLPHRWLAGSGRRHDLVEHAKHPGHALAALGDLRHMGRDIVDRWPGEPAPELTEKNAWSRREFLLGGKIDTWVPRLHEGCMQALARTVEGAGAARSFLVILPVRPMLRGTVEAEYWSAARQAFRDLAQSLPRTALLDYSTFGDADESLFNDFDHLGEAGATAFSGDFAGVVE
ncbi:MAG: hypothetical protein FJ102_09130 [Deltaproteobacteria bacterium]|nr:hypothetical protein [Deltaproteobacteria bacterium]